MEALRKSNMQLRERVLESSEANTSGSLNSISKKDCWFGFWPEFLVFLGTK